MPPSAGHGNGAGQGTRDCRHSCNNWPHPEGDISSGNKRTACGGKNVQEGGKAAQQSSGRNVTGPEGDRTGAGAEPGQVQKLETGRGRGGTQRASAGVSEDGLRPNQAMHELEGFWHRVTWF